MTAYGSALAPFVSSRMWSKKLTFNASRVFSYTSGSAFSSSVSSALVTNAWNHCSIEASSSRVVNSSTIARNGSNRSGCWSLRANDNACNFPKVFTTNRKCSNPCSLCRSNISKPSCFRSAMKMASSYSRTHVFKHRGTW
uniref:(northern house mosquito) hypothetical protein n=1 Tax=Culex pipiens TaxID=7175 RepID=A0A8D8AW76_CULPI